MKRAVPFLLLGLALAGVGVLLADPDSPPATGRPSGARASGAAGTPTGLPSRVDVRLAPGALDPAPDAGLAANVTPTETASTAPSSAPGTGAGAPAGSPEAPGHPGPAPGSLQDLIGALRAGRAPADPAAPPPGTPLVRSPRAPGAPVAWIPTGDGGQAPIYTPEERAVLRAEAEEVRSRRGSIVGALEEAGPAGIGGWAYDWADPQAVLTVALFVDGFPLGRVQADQPRAATAAGPSAAGPSAGGVARLRGFFAPAPPGLDDGEAHTVQAVVVLSGGEEALELRHSPRRVGGQRLAHGELRVVSETSPPRASGWASDDDRAEPLTVRILVDGQQVARVRADGALPVAGAPPGRGFSAPLPGLDPRRSHVVQAVIEDLDLPGLLRECRGSPARLAPREGPGEEDGEGGGEENQPPTGAVTFVDAQVITGWARDPESGSTPIEVDVSFDGGPARRLRADQDFPALAYSGLPSTRHLFRVEVPAELQDGRTHLVSVFAVDPQGGPSPELSGSPASFRAAVNHAPVGYLDVVSHDLIAGWAYDADLGPAPVEVEVWIDGQLWQVIEAGQVRPDLVPVACAEPAHGFSLPAPEQLRDGRFHTVRALVRNHPQGPPRELPRSPWELGALRPWLGLSAGEQAGRLVITSLAPAGPAERAGLRVGDALLTLDGEPAPVDAAALAAWVAARVPGQVVAVGIERQEPLGTPPPGEPQATGPVQRVIQVALEERVETS